MGLHLDLEKIFLENRQKSGPNVMRKAGLIINTGDNPTKAQVNAKRDKNKKKYGLSVQFVENLKLPKAMTKEWLKVLTYDQIMRNASNFSTVEKIHHLTILQEALERKLGKIQFLEKRNSENFKLCKIGIVF